MTKLARSIVPALAGFFVVASAQAQNLTVQIGSAAPPPVPVVNHGDTWYYHKGTNAPVVGWQTAADAALGGQWLNGPGGIGYSADTAGETNKCLTILTDMRNLYTTLYFRRTFQIASAVDPTSHIQLTMDYDDGFVAYLDGVEVLRANAGGTVGTEPPITQTAPVTHESSLGTAPVNAPVVYDLGAVGTRLAVGTHVLAFIGINNALASSDLIMVPDLAVTGSAAGSAVNGTFFSIVYGGSVALTGSNTVAGSTRVTVNGDEAVYDSVARTWSKTNSLVPGVNKLFIAALDATGNLLGSTNRMVISEVASNTIGGTLGANTVLGPGVVHVSSTAVVPPGGTLAIQPGTVCLMSPVSHILATNATLNATGTLANPIYFLPSDGSTTNWGELAISGTTGTMLLQHLETIAGHIEVFDGAMGTLEDSFFHDYWTASPAIIHTLGQPNTVTLNLRRCHIARYQEVLSQLATNHFDDNLLEYQGYSGDGIDFDFGQEGSYIRRCTVRRGLIFNTDAIDMGEFGANGTRVLIDSCLLHDFIDKGVSMGVHVYVTVTNTLIYNVDSGFGIKDLSEAGIYNCTVANSYYGYHEYKKNDPASPTGGGFVTNSFNNIFWNMTGASLSLSNGSTVTANYTDFQNTNWPGTGNISADPLFVNAAIHDYRVSAGSPTLGAGLGGANLGVTLPVGGIPATPLAFAAIGSGTGPVQLVWQDDSDNETSVVIERSTNGINWSVVGSAGENATNYTDNTVVAGVKYYYRAYTSNSSGNSAPSNIASSRSLIVVAGGSVGGTITQDTCWAANGVFTVTNSITVPAGVTLYIKPGAQVRFGASMTMTVNGQLNAVGQSTNRIHFTKSGASNWGSLDFLNAPNESRIEFADFDSCAGTTIGGHAAEVHVNGASKVFFNWLNFANVPAQEYISFDGSTFIVQNSTFPTYPWATSAPEMLHGINGINAGGYGIFRSNYFGHTFGFNDTIDFTGGQRPGPILQFIGNVFDGAGDDHLDLDSTDAWIEGNIFMHVHRDPNRSDRADDTGSAISGGVDVDGQFSEWTIINNLFYDVDHVCLNKGGVGSGAGRLIFMNNTVVHVNQESGAGPSTNIAAFIFTDDQVAFPGATYGAGAYIANNIFWDCPMLATNYNVANHTVIFENNIVPGAWGGTGSNNVVIDPLLNLQLITTVTNASAAQVRAAFMPKTNSPALASGFGAKYDRGGIQPLGMMIVGEPTNSASSNALLTVGPIEPWRTGSAVPAFNAGYTFYKWKLDNGPWSAELSTTNSPTIALSNLASGAHTVYVVGKNDAGYYQDDTFVYPADIALIAAHATASRTWVVGSGSLDTDGDGMPDAWEIANGLNPNFNDAALDPDGDGMTNLQEYLAGTDPHAANSSLRLFSLSQSGGSFYFNFAAVSNKTYTVQYRSSLSTGSWQTLQSVSAAPSNHVIVITNVPALPAQFYQVATP